MSLILNQSSEFTTLVYKNFKKSSEYWLRNELFAYVLEADQHIRNAFDKDVKKSFIKTLESARTCWKKIQILLLTAETLEVLPAAQIEKIMQKLERIQKLSYGLLKHIEGSRQAKKEAAVA